MTFKLVSLGLVVGVVQGQNFGMEMAARVQESQISNFGESRNLQNADMEFINAFGTCSADPACINCSDLTTIFQSPTCAALLTDSTNAITPDTSDGESTGVWALMIDAPVPDQFVPQICDGWKNEPLATECIQPSPFKSFITTLLTSPSCTDLLTALESDSDGYSSTDSVQQNQQSQGKNGPPPQLSPTQSLVANGVIEGFFMALGKNVTAMKEALGDNGLTLLDFVSPFLGIKGKSPRGAFENKTKDCVQNLIHRENIKDDDIKDFVVRIGERNETIPKDTIDRAIYSHVFKEELPNFLSGLNRTDIPQKIRDRVSDRMNDIDASGNHTNLLRDARDEIGEHCLNNATSPHANLTHFNMQKLNASDADAYTPFVLTACNATTLMNNTGCTDPLVASIEEFGKCMRHVKEKVDEKFEDFRMKLDDRLKFGNRTKIFEKLPEIVGECMGPRFPKVKGEIEKYTKYLDWKEGNAPHNPPPELLKYEIEMLRVTVGCELTKAGLVDGLDPEMFSKEACYNLAIMSSPLANYMDLTPDQMLLLADSTHNIQKRCTAAQVDIGHVGPTIVTGSPTTSPSPGALNAATRSVINVALFPFTTFLLLLK